MMYEQMILTRLLDKYEKSAHFKGSAVANRRVLLRCDGQTLGLDFSDYHVCEELKQNVLALAERGWIQFSWKRKNYLVDQVWLETDRLEEIYAFLHRPDKRTQIDLLLREIHGCLESVHTAWIQQYLSSAYEDILQKQRLSGIWNSEPEVVRGLLAVLREIDQLDGREVSMRALSVALFSDSKYFERNLKAPLLSIIRQYEPSVADAEEIDDREALAQVGMILMPEVFEFCGPVCVKFSGGTTDFTPIKMGACLSGACVPDLQQMQIRGAKRVLFLENKTNYSEYVLNQYQGDELVIYHGGFYSPAKAQFFRRIAQGAAGLPMFFWGDIDLGGFRMFCRLKKNLIPELQPLNMGVTEYRQYRGFGVPKSDTYLCKLKELLQDESYAVFHAVIREILQYKCIVEQENFLNRTE